MMCHATQSLVSISDKLTTLELSLKSLKNSCLLTFHIVQEVFKLVSKLLSFGESKGEVFNFGPKDSCIYKKWVFDDPEMVLSKAW
jgi:hypothetical protein